MALTEVTLGAGGSGAPGKSAYELAQDEGFTGTLEEWLESLKGEDATGGGGPSDAFSPSNKPRLSALGTSDFSPALASTGDANWRFWGSSTGVLANALSYKKLTVPLRSANVVGGEQLVAVVVKKVAGSYLVVQRLTQALIAGQASAEWDVNLNFASGENWGVMVGINGGASPVAFSNRFYDNVNSLAPAPFAGAAFRTDDEQTGGANANTGASDSVGAIHRVFQLIGVNDPKGVQGKADPPDITFSGTTAQRPAGMPTGFAYFDTTLGIEINWNGSGWVNSTGSAV